MHDSGHIIERSGDARCPVERVKKIKLEKTSGEPKTKEI